ncbi:thioesterase II family protein [Streptomyces brevispora]|uniref:Alpha/beta fold hydrolase n=1 Tax=Streptomyces brevispora TaxID=887462 RepID=A0A561V5D2_9ACTN|nr:alpha/beta fold hydrolase [Streptomyces brevispora]TWG06840.1 surfactin synthase thioesterase subunit [Streptomyces brevispora]WSC12292.1 alpha/beta fold hydrolase [Streptomyces brevispora]
MGAVGSADTGSLPAAAAGVRWTRNWRPRPGAAVNLLCLPHAGGSAGFYRSWVDLLPAEVDFHAVQYPGREDRITEAPVSCMTELADAITEAIRPLFEKDVILFGHSMGASVAYEVTRRCEAEGLSPRLLLVSGRAAPRWPHGAPPRRPRTDDEIVHEIRGFSTAGSTALDDPDLRELLLPMIRADYRLVEGYRPDRPGPVRAPIAVLRGRDDVKVTPEGAAAWREFSTTHCTEHVFDGGHFYLRANERPVLGALAELIARALR